MALVKVLLVNDDGPDSVPFMALLRELSGARVGELYVITPERQMSAAGKGITFHKPLRLYNRRIEVDDTTEEIYLTNGTPADCVLLALNVIVGDKPDIVISGINMGDNTTVDSLFTSATIAGALQAVLNGCKAVSFSAEIPSELTTLEIDHFARHARMAVEVSSWMTENELPGVHLLNVNFPYEVTGRTPIRITRLGWTKFNNLALKRTDPRGKPYYWIVGEQKDLAKESKDTDVYALGIERAISITPIRVDLGVLQVMEDDPWELRRGAELSLNSLSNLVSRLEGVREELD